MSQANRMLDVADIKAFVMAGNARITLVSKKTGARFTYRVRASRDRNVHFVSLLTGTDNTNDYSYIGIIRNNEFTRTVKSLVSLEAPSAKAFIWFFYQLFHHDKLFDTLEVWHSGKCGRCNRDLTVPESILRGIGPECWSKMRCEEVK